MRRHFEARVRGAPDCDSRDVRVRLLVPLGAERARARSTRCSSRRQAHRGPDRRCRRRPCTRRCATRRRAWSRSGRWSSRTRSARSKRWDAPFDETLGDEPARQARAADRRSRAALDRAQRPCRRRRRAPRRAAGRHPGAGAPARRAVRGDHPRAEERGHRGRGRRPAGADRAHRGDGPDGARRRAAAAGGRSRARDRAQEPAVRPDRRRPVRARLRAARARCARRCARRRADLEFADATRGSTRCARCGARESPFAFYARAARRRRRARKRFLARLGPEANDALDEFLNLALDYERRETPSLQGFVAWLRAGAGRGQARHGDRARRGAGDDGARRQGPGSADRHPRRHHHARRRARPAQPRLLPLPAQDAAPGTPDRLVWAGARRTTSPPVAAARATRRAATPRTNIAGCSMSR